MDLALHFYSPLFSVLFVSTLHKLGIYTSYWYLQHVTWSFPIRACPFVAKLFIFFRICLLLKLLQSKMNLQDLCRMQNIFYYRQKIPLGLIVQTWLFFFFSLFTVWRHSGGLLSWVTNIWNWINWRLLDSNWLPVIHNTVVYSRIAYLTELATPCFHYHDSWHYCVHFQFKKS